ncbi:MAG TPA: hypothetical protein VGK38_08490 [Prolixibacteraceae bacterium]|jgi:ribosomal protein L23
METIQIIVSPKANKLKLIAAIEMLKGVKSVKLTSDPMTEDEYLAKQMNSSRKSGKGSKKNTIEYLSK